MSTKPEQPALPPTAEVRESKVYPFSEVEYRRDIAAGIDDVLVEQLKNPKTHKWLLALPNNCLSLNKIPTTWRKSKNIAILKPGKDSAIPKSYRSISLQYHTYTLYKRLIPNRISPTIEEHLNKEQAGFHPGKVNC